MENKNETKATEAKALSEYTIAELEVKFKEVNEHYLGLDDALTGAERKAIVNVLRCGDVSLNDAIYGKFLRDKVTGKVITMESNFPMEDGDGYGVELCGKNKVEDGEVLYYYVIGKHQKAINDYPDGVVRRGMCATDWFILNNLVGKISFKEGKWDVAYEYTKVLEPHINRVSYLAKMRAEIQNIISEKEVEALAKLDQEALGITDADLEKGAKMFDLSTKEGLNNAKKKASELRKQAEELGVDVSKIKVGKQVKTVEREVTALREAIAEQA